MNTTILRVPGTAKSSHFYLSIVKDKGIAETNLYYNVRVSMNPLMKEE